MIRQSKQLIPGFLVCLAISITAQFLVRWVPQLGAALLAILFGILLGNTLFTQNIWAKGVRFSESRLLEYSIALTGLTLNLTDLLKVGPKGILFIAVQMSATIAVVYLLGHLLSFSKKFRLLMAAGNAVCGSSAIGTVTPVLKADDKDKGISITIVNLTGTVLMVLLPILTSVLYHHQTVPTSAMIGGTLQSIGQVIASAKLVNEPVVQLATIFKIIRIIFLVFVTFLFTKMNTDDQQKAVFQTKETQQNKPNAKKVHIPWFIYLFFLFCCLVSFLPISSRIPVAAKTISNQFEIIALAGIGMRVKFADIKKEGPKAMGYGLLTGTCQIAIAGLLIYILFL